MRNELPIAICRSQDFGSGIGSEHGPCGCFAVAISGVPSLLAESIDTGSSANATLAYSQKQTKMMALG